MSSSKFTRNRLASESDTFQSFLDIRVGDRVSVRSDGTTDERLNATVEVIHDMPWSFDVLYDV